MRKLLLLLSVLALSAPAAAEEKLVDESTGVGFANQVKVDGTDYRCLGAGVRAVRKVFLFRAYAVSYCLEASKVDEVLVGYLQKNHPNQKGPELVKALQNDQKFYDALSNAPGDKLVIMHLVRNISKDQIAGAFRDSLSDVLPKAKVDMLIDTIPGDAKEGQRILLHSHGNRLVIDIAGNAKNIEDEQIAKNLWRVWLGPESVSPSLKESIAQHVASRVK